MSINTRYMKPPMQYALLFAALFQVFPLLAQAKDAESKDADANNAKVCEHCPEPGEKSAWIEAGISQQSDDSSHFGRYTGRHEAGTAINLNGEFNYRDTLNTGAYLNGQFVDVGLDSRLLSVQGGRQGKYDLAVEYDELPNHRKTLSRATLETQRDRLGVKFALTPAKLWEVNGHFQRENKEGIRDTGASFGFGIPQILAVPVDYQTDDFGLALGYQGERLSARLAYDGSLFNNANEQINWTYPPLLSTTGQIAESPDNEFHQISAQLGYRISDKTQLNGSFARGKMTQDQNFLAYGTAGAAAALPLPASNLNGEVNTTLAKLDINSRPTPRVRLDASYTFSDRDNSTPINAYTYVLNDNFVMLDAGGQPVARQNLPYSFAQNLLRLKAGYRFANGADISAGFDNDSLERTYQQAEETEDRTLWTKLKIQPMNAMEAAIKLAHSDRDASAYDPTAYQHPSYPNSGARPGDPLLKPFQLADRTRDTIGFDLSYTPKDNLSLSLNVDHYQDDYSEMVLGLTEAKGISLTPTLSYTFSERLNASAYQTWEKLESKQSGREWFDAQPASPGVLWLASDSHLTQTTGVNINWTAIPKKLELGADVVYAEFSGQMKYASGGKLPKLTESLRALGVHGTYKLKENLSLRVDYRYEKYREYDWANIEWSNLVTLGTAPETEETHLVYIAARYTFK